MSCRMRRPNALRDAPDVCARRRSRVGAQCALVGAGQEPHGDGARGWAHAREQLHDVPLRRHRRAAGGASVRRGRLPLDELPRGGQDAQLRRPDALLIGQRRVLRHRRERSGAGGGGVGVNESADSTARAAAGGARASPWPVRSPVATPAARAIVLWTGYTRLRQKKRRRIIILTHMER
eukprot:6385326-Prymnesium_polylepis.1